MSAVALAELTRLSDTFLDLLALEKPSNRGKVLAWFLLYVHTRLEEIDQDANDMIDRFDPPYG